MKKVLVVAAVLPALAGVGLLALRRMRGGARGPDEPLDVAEGYPPSVTFLHGHPEPAMNAAGAA